MPVKLDLGVTLAELDALSQHDETSVEVPKGTIEVVVDSSDPEQGFATFNVQGLLRDEARFLRSQLFGFLASIGELFEHQEKRRQELNPDSLPALRLITQARLNAQFGGAFAKADRGLSTAAKEIVRRMVVGYAPGELIMGGQPIPWQTEQLVVEGKARSVASRRILEALRLSGLLISVATACADFSEKGSYPTAAEQFAAAQKIQAEAAESIGSFLRAQHPDKKAAPFLPAAHPDDTPNTPTSSPDSSESPLPSDDTSESELATKSPETS